MKDTNPGGERYEIIMYAWLMNLSSTERLHALLDFCENYMLLLKNGTVL